MRVAFKMSLNFRTGKDRRVMSSDWTSYAMERFNERRKTQTVNNAKALMDRDTLDLNCPGKWREFCDAFKSSCADCNSKSSNGSVLSIRELDVRTLQIDRTDNAERLIVSFDSSRHSLSLEGPRIEKKDQSIAMTVVGASTIEMKNSIGEPMSVHGVVQEALKTLLDV